MKTNTMKFVNITPILCLKGVYCIVFLIASSMDNRGGHQYKVLAHHIYPVSLSANMGENGNVHIQTQHRCRPLTIPVAIISSCFLLVFFHLV